MNVWRGFTLALWIVSVTVLSAFVMQYHAFKSTALDSQQVKSELKKSGAYEMLRDTYLTGSARAVIQEKYPDNKLVDDVFITAVLAETLPSRELPVRLDPVVDATYRWFDSKEPEILFAVDLSDREDIFYRSLEVQLGKRVSALPSCGDYRYPPEEAVLVDRCIPVYTSEDEITEAIVEGVKLEGSPLEDPITSEMFSLPEANKATLKQIPTYLNYLWVLNVIALILVGLIAVFLVASRKVLGLAAIGLSMVLAGLAVFVTIPLVTSLQRLKLEGDAGLVHLLLDAFLPSYVSLSSSYGFISIGVGTLSIVIMSLWKWRGRLQRAK